MGNLNEVRGEIVDSAIAEVQHAFMIWDEPPVEAIAKSVLNVVAKVLEDNENLIAPDTTGKDAYKIAINLLKN